MAYSEAKLMSNDVEHLRVSLHSEYEFCVYLYINKTSIPLFNVVQF